MLELVEFPHLPSGDPAQAVSALIRLCREMPAQGEQFRFFRKRAKDLRLWDDQLILGTLAFLDMEKTGNIRPSQFARQVGKLRPEEKARDVFTERLWEVNPLLFRSVVTQLKEQVHSRDELIKHIHSFAYRGKQPTRPQLENWLHLALGLRVLKMVGIALDLDDRGKALVARASDFDVEEFLADMAGEAGEDGGEDFDEDAEFSAEGDDADGGDETAEAPAAAAPASAPAAAASAPRPAAKAAPGGAAAADGGEGLDLSALASPRGRERPVEVHRFAGQAVFDDEILAETTRRVAAWWGEQSPEMQRLSAEDFGFSSEAWMESGDELLYRIAVAAALSFRLQRGREGVMKAFEALDQGGVLGDLYYGTAPDELPNAVDAQALMLASLIARRCAEAPELAATLEKQQSASDAFGVLEQALGRGLLRIELFWMMAALADVGALRFPDLGDYLALPRRLVRDTLFRLGYLATPYAHDAASLVPAAREAHRAADGATRADEVLLAFALKAGCAYGCAHRRSCEYACRERAE
ncbi:hypothetical protein [Haliangium ochraceum]|uniref:Uncharacterized protein n=1 Tax=Haliangium ochraceum (strain DSM 14365 / JCM 11303 / SMP-2) TaxID=502025 RepID=D0LRJ4_HALO1|nr:hypothetical protein [Haliangium ochraceum]ACY17222.1 hypothetical protein Hoch_4732 [Haliangium ochraceum DSM 14365]